MHSFSDLALQVDRLLRRINADLHPKAQQFDHEKVGPIGGMLLLAIGESQPINLQTLVSRMGRDKSQITRLVQSLERKGLILRQRSETDGRESLLCLSPKGHAQLASIQSALTDVIKHIFEPLTETETRQFSDLLERLLIE